MSTHPIWYLNMIANPQVQCQIGNDKRSYISRRATPQEEQKLWPALDTMYKGYAQYRERIGERREIPVMILEPK
jgi:deazaflavin-dependent oxidoreductase (nitroreductase family)